MAIYLIDKIKPKNNGTFAMVDAADVEMGDGTRLDAFLAAMAGNSGNLDIDYEADLAFDTEELVVGMSNSLVPDEPDIPDDNTDTPAILGVAVLGRTILGKY